MWTLPHWLTLCFQLFSDSNKIASCYLFVNLTPELKLLRSFLSYTWIIVCYFLPVLPWSHIFSVRSHILTEEIRHEETLNLTVNMFTITHYFKYYSSEMPMPHTPQLHLMLKGDGAMHYCFLGLSFYCTVKHLFPCVILWLILGIPASGQCDDVACLCSSTVQ